MSVKFAFGGYETSFHNWCRPYKQMSIEIGREYDDDTPPISIKDEFVLLKELVAKHPERVLKKRQSICRKDPVTGNYRELEYVTDSFFLLDNQEYKSSDDVTYYSVGSINTRQTTHIRLKFKIEDATFAIEDSFLGEGPYACTVKDYCIFRDPEYGIEEVIDEILEKGLPIEETGIVKGHDEDYKIAAINEVGHCIDFEISKDDLLRSLICVEMFKFDYEITDIKKEETTNE